MSFYTVALAGGGAVGAIIGGVFAPLALRRRPDHARAGALTATFLTLGPVVRYERTPTAAGVRAAVR